MIKAIALIIEEVPEKLKRMLDYIKNGSDVAYRREGL